MNIVLDTTVLVSGLLTPYGPAGEVVRLVSAGVLMVQYDARVLLEYRSVLSRPKFQFEPGHVDTLLTYIKQNGQAVSGGLLKERLPDPDDEPFLEIAFAGKAECLITGNTKHFPIRSRQGVILFSPSEFVDFYRTHKSK